MTPGASRLVAGLAATAVLVGTPAGVALVLARPLAPGAHNLGATLLLELAAAVAWVACFSLLDLASQRSRLAGAAPQNTLVFVVALVAGVMGFYRTESLGCRLAYSVQYGILVLVAFALFSWLVRWLSTTRSRHSRSAA